MRTRNLTSNHECRYCDDGGWVVVDAAFAKKKGEGKHREIQRRLNWGLPIRIEGVAPCPFCEQGYANEFPGTDKAGRDYFPFGRDGYWQGRDTSFLRPRPVEVMATREQNLAGMKEILKRLGSATKEMPA